ncbi:hypothetical protein Tco_1506425 [Tanacetum coccineum]
MSKLLPLWRSKLPLTKDEEALKLDVTPKTSHLTAVKRIFKYLKGKPNLGLWYPRDSPLDLEAFSDSDYGGSNLDRKSTTGGCQFLGQRLISWQCKKQTIVLLGVEKGDARSTWTWKRKCQLSLANWMQFGQKGSRVAQEEQISPSTFGMHTLLTNVASGRVLKGHKHLSGSKIFKRKSKSTKNSTKMLHFEEPDSAQVNYLLKRKRVQTREKGKEPMTEEDLQAEVQASKTSKELQELADLEEAKRVQAKMDAETQRQIDLDALLARRLVEQEEEAAREALATEFDYIQSTINMLDQILAEKIQQKKGSNILLRKSKVTFMTQLLPQRKFLQNKGVFIEISHQQYLSSEIQYDHNLETFGNKKHR